MNVVGALNSEIPRGRIGLTTVDAEVIEWKGEKAVVKAVKLLRRSTLDLSLEFWYDC